MKNLCFALVLSCISFSALSQAPFSLTSLLRRIQKQQTVSDPYFIPGIFPSYISDGPSYKEEKKDINVFYNALIGYTLKSLKSDLSVSDQLIIDSIQMRNENLYPRFRNAKGRMSYNFARTDTAFTFPFNKWIPKLRGDLAFPDDLDCTALILMSRDSTDSAAKEVHELMQGYVNSEKTKTTYRSYRKIPAYSVWFGNKFPVVLDVSVLCNILCLVQENDLPWTAADSASLLLIVKTIKQNDQKNSPRFVSPYYPKHSLILYHLARLMSVKPIVELETLKPRLVEETRRIILRGDNTLEKIMLNSALMKWGAPPIPIGISDEQLSVAVINNDLSFFAGNIPSYMKQPIKGVLTKTRTLQYYYYCSAFNDTLLLEYLVLKKKNAQ